MKTAPAEASLRKFMSAYTPEIISLTERCLAKLRKLLPGADQLVYDNYNALVVTFGASVRPSDIVCSIALYPKWITMFFLHGATLEDPTKLLGGSGKTIRGVKLESDAMLDGAPLRALIKRAVAGAPSMLDARKGATIVIQSVSPTQRPRRPPPSSKPTSTKIAKTGKPKTPTKAKTPTTKSPAKKPTGAKSR